jgi:hypothetical protein
MGSYTVNSFPRKLRTDRTITVKLPSGASVDLPICYTTFSIWDGVAPAFDFGNKPILALEGKPVFAELVILRLLQSEGWEGAWIETYGGTHYLQDMPAEWKLQSGHVAIPPEREMLLKRIWKQGKTTACFDVMVWKDDQVLFCEAKRKGKDRLTNAQYKFIEGALECGLKPEQLLIVEWDFADETGL